MITSCDDEAVTTLKILLNSALFFWWLSYIIKYHVMRKATSYVAGFEWSGVLKRMFGNDLEDYYAFARIAILQACSQSDQARRPF